jgi:hypothetical protein
MSDHYGRRAIAKMSRIGEVGVPDTIGTVQLWGGNVEDESAT